MSSVRPIAFDDPEAIRAPVAVARHVQASAEPCDTGRRAPVTHSYATVALYTAGAARMELDGEWLAEPGDVLLVPAGTPHRLLERRRSEYWGLSFCVPCYAAEGAAILLDPFERVREGASAIVHIPAARQEHLEGLFRELERTGRDASAQSAVLEVVQRSLLTLILNEIDRAARPDAAPGGMRAGVVVDSLRFIERNCLRRLTLGEVARAVGRSPAYVTNALTRATGRSAGEWIVNGRMAEARRLLLHSDERVDIIAERVGYSDATHFIRMFRRVHGATPAAWRTAHPRAARQSS